VNADTGAMSAHPFSNAWERMFERIAVGGAAGPDISSTRRTGQAGDHRRGRRRRGRAAPVPRSLVEPGSPCRSRSGTVTGTYHTGRFTKVPRLAKLLRVPHPTDRRPGQLWRPGTPPPAPIPAGTPVTDIRVGYARCSHLTQELQLSVVKGFGPTCRPWDLRPHRNRPCAVRVLRSDG
jgi:hypothetical protein